MVYPNTTHRIIFGDSRSMKEIPDESVHLIVTSPPYWQLKDYGSPAQIGFHDSYEEYINNLNLVWQECFRILHPGTRMCINIGDQFARSVYYGRYKVIPIRTEIIKFAEAIGFDYMGSVIWQKRTTMNTTGGASVMGSYPYPRNGVVEIDYEFILLFKKSGIPPKVDRATRELAKLTSEEWKEYFAGHWYFNGEKQLDHIAMFPEELPRRLIKMFTFPGEVVVDPFLGSGTTSLAAVKLGRSSIGYEINQEFESLIQKKLGSPVSFQKQICNDGEQNLTQRLVCLPYLFKDPVKLTKKLDPRKFRFGSRITSQDDYHREEYYRVKEVLSPERVLLSNDVTIRLIGVKSIPEKYTEAVSFLKNRTLNTAVYLRFDSEKYDEDSNLLVYLYCKDRTFLNAHLIKRRLVRAADTNFRYRDKFTALAATQI